MDMGVSYTVPEFRAEIALAKPLLQTVVNTRESLGRELAQRVSEIAPQSRIAYLGSTNPDRMTAMLDPKAPDLRYQCDFDIAIFLERDRGMAVDEPALLRSFIPDGDVVRTHGRYEIRAVRNRFPVCAAIVFADELERYAPVIYADRHAAVTPEEADAVRALRLWVMRNGTYGGFTGGLKGIALEQMVKSQGGFEATVNWLAEELRIADRITVPSPLDGSDLCKTVSPRVWQRIKTAAQLYARDGLVRAVPYSLESWQEDHPQELIMELSAPPLDQRDIYQKVARFARNALKEIRGEVMPEHDVLVIPRDGEVEVLLSIAGLPQDRKEGFIERFTRRWDFFNLNPTQ